MKKTIAAEFLESALLSECIEKKTILVRIMKNLNQEGRRAG